ncbi:MAG: MoaD/ThiS family protein [Gammaproteobacteria bacterium]|nr:MoaD/ThiS family protein [Gammaproteobacteria bacterium]
MASVVLGTEIAREFAGGETHLEVEAKDFRELVKMLEARFPGIAEALKIGVAVAIDGEIFQEPFLEPIGETSEVYFLPAIEGG